MFKLLTENWALKLLSMVFALILWFFVMGERKLERSYAVPLEMKNLPTAMMIANEVPNEVAVRISGPRTLLMNMGAEDLRIVVDLQDLSPGLTSFIRLDERLNIPAPLKVTRLSPSYVDVKVERIGVKKVPVNPLLKGIPAEGFRVEKVSAVPASVIVEGAQGELDALQQIDTTPLNIAGTRSNLVEAVPLGYRGKFTWLKNPQNVEVKVTIGHRP
jgi:YbbR domain-containing protein